jgi:hypothetical protein
MGGVLRVRSRRSNRLGDCCSSVGKEAPSDALVRAKPLASQAHFTSSAVLDSELLRQVDRLASCSGNSLPRVKTIDEITSSDTCPCLLANEISDSSRPVR